MKIAISIPDDVFDRVQRAAKRLGVSRSELFSRAAVELLDELARADVTESYDRAFGDERAPSAADDSEAELRRRAARRALRDVDW